MKKCAVVYNPISGKKIKYDFLPKFKQILNDNDYEVEIITTEYKGHAIEIIKKLSYRDLVISIGGDGTFNEAVTGNYQREEKLVLAHLPVGTTNDIGKMFGYGKNIIENLKITLKGTVKNVDICLINGRPFVYVAGLGKFVTVAYETPRYLKKKIGYLAYLIEGIKDFFKPVKLYNLTYEINGIEKTGYYSFMLISNANRIAGINNFYKDVKLDDNEFEVLLCNFRNRIDIIKTLKLLTTNDINKVSGLEFYKTDKIKLKFANYPDKSWCIDGEKLDRSKLNYTVSIINDFEILMPTTYNDELFVKKEGN